MRHIPFSRIFKGQSLPGAIVPIFEKALYARYSGYEIVCRIFRLWNFSNAFFRRQKIFFTKSSCNFLACSNIGGGILCQIFGLWIFQRQSIFIVIHFNDRKLTYPFLSGILCTIFIPSCNQSKFGGCGFVGFAVFALPFKCTFRLWL